MVDNSHPEAIQQSFSYILVYKMTRYSDYVGADVLKVYCVNQSVVDIFWLPLKDYFNIFRVHKTHLLAVCYLDLKCQIVWTECLVNT